MTFAGKWLSRFTAYQHALLWKKRCKTQHWVLGPVIKTWYWYDNWLNEVQEYCGKAETHINKLSPTKVCRILDLNGIIVLICIFV
jgi:hypothetical protein